MVAVLLFIYFYYEYQNSLVPSKIDDHFYIGNRHSILYYEIFEWDRILSINGDPHYEYDHILNSNTKHMHIQSDDYGSGINPKILYEALEFLIQGYNKNEKILIHCVVGKNRSVSLLCAFYMHQYNIKFSQALKFIKEKRKIASVTLFQKNKIINSLQFLKSKSLPEIVKTIHHK